MVPTFDYFLYPYLLYLQDGSLRSKKEIDSFTKDFLKISDTDAAELTKGGSFTKLYDRVQWSGTYLRKAGLTFSPKPRLYQITEDGKRFLSCHKDGFKKEDLLTIPSFEEFANSKPKDSTTPTSSTPATAEEKTPTEVFEDAFHSINNSLAEELLAKIIEMSPDFFERLVVDLLVKMGYGGGYEDSAMVTQHSKDNGIDGVIKEDRLGLDKIYIQAKRWTTTVVGKPDIHAFVGALSEQGAKKGVYITTSSFSKEARNFKPQADIKVILIDGTDLCRYMIEYGVGVSVRKTYEIKKIDNDYFEE